MSELTISEALEKLSNATELRDKVLAILYVFNKAINEATPEVLEELFPHEDVIRREEFIHRYSVEGFPLALIAEFLGEDIDQVDDAIRELKAAGLVGQR